MGIVMGIDHGNGHIKAISGQRKINLPSVYALPYEEGESYAAGADDVSKTLVFQVEDSGTYLWGKDVATHARTTYSTYGNDYEKNEFRLLSTFAVSALLPQNRMTTFDEITIVTGYPSQEKGTKKENELREAFLGEHAVVINGQRKVAKVTNVYTLPQPLGTIMYLYLNDEGYVADEAYETSYCGIIDIGSGTTDMDGVNALKRQTSDIATIQRGMFDVYKEIAREIFVESGGIVKPSPQQIEAQILAGNKEYVHSERTRYHLEKYVQKHMSEFFNYLKNRIDEHWSKEKRAQFDRLILTGGGAANKYLANALQEWLGDVIIVPKSQEANAVGFYRYGVFKTQDEA